ncbi:hypothetical protein KPL74_03565 [Bacillus sp. NP157]|nr:hypothetical protein KPL74_03565 [Bacillus sp. NP157]
MNHPDDSIDALLRQAFDGPVADDGFVDRLMPRIPTRKPRRAAWPLLAGVAGGGVACFLSLQQVPLWRGAWHDLMAGRLSAGVVVVAGCMVVMAVLAMTWSLFELEDR